MNIPTINAKMVGNPFSAAANIQSVGRGEMKVTIEMFKNSERVVKFERQVGNINEALAKFEEEVLKLNERDALDISQMLKESVLSFF